MVPREVVELAIKDFSERKLVVTGSNAMSYFQLP